MKPENDLDIAQYSVALHKAARELNAVIASGNMDALITLSADIQFYATRLGFRARDLKYRVGM